MKLRKIITALAATLVLTGAVVSGVAAASSGGSDPKAGSGTAVSTARAAGETAPSVENSAADPDDVQEGDQTGPEEADVNEGPEAGSEGVESDGPGGHEDPAGDVNHGFEGEE